MAKLKEKLHEVWLTGKGKSVEQDEDEDSEWGEDNSVNLTDPDDLMEDSTNNLTVVKFTDRTVLIV